MPLAASLDRLAQSAVCSVLTCRPNPSHVAFIMDGNRRHAEARRQPALAGHTQGYSRLIQSLEWCLELGVTTVSVYAFSIENYGRGEEEVEGLMHLAEQKFLHMLGEVAVLERRGVRVRVLGDLTLAPPAVRRAAEHVQALTAAHDRVTFNICFSYSASSEMLAAQDAAARHEPCSPASPPFTQGESARTGADRGPGCAREGPCASWRCHLAQAGTPPVDLLVRTSGERRLSDFLQWQSRHAHLFFSPTLWPDFSFWDLAAAVLSWQRAAPHLRETRRVAAARAAAAGAAGAAASAEPAVAVRAEPGVAVSAALPVEDGPLRQASEDGQSCEVESEGGASEVESEAGPGSPLLPWRATATGGVRVAAG
uniref:Alkyl transferase n=1 Tax=Auxenochlorella protothecoides TaxID=3075 RepID=A0A1D2A6D9_AUXPR